jgi:hypothetical protein
LFSGNELITVQDGLMNREEEGSLNMFQFSVVKKKLKNEKKNEKHAHLSLGWEGGGLLTDSFRLSMQFNPKR